MSDAFVPVTKSPPAKVKDPGLIALVLAGAGAYNAKSGDLLLLPAGRARTAALAEELLAVLLRDTGFQPVDALGSDAAVWSLAERYVREYRGDALRWAQVHDRMVGLQGWYANCDEADAACAKAVDAVQTALARELRDILRVTKVFPGKKESLLLAVETEKGAEGAEAAFRCADCGAAFLPDSIFRSDEPPVNAGAAEAPVADVHTPGTHTIPLLCEYLKIPIETTLKAMLYTMELPGGEKKLLFAMIRGDRDISIPKLAAWVEGNYPGATFRRAEAAEIVAAFGEVAGFCGPVGVPDNVQMVADRSLKDGKNFVVGGNRPDYHKTGCCWGRDFEPPLADLTLIEAGMPCPVCGGAMREITLRPLAMFYNYDSAAAGENILSCRDRDGAHEWPCRMRGQVFLTSVILACYEQQMEKPEQGKNQEESQ